MDIDAVLFDWGGTLASVDRQKEALEKGAARVLEILVGQAPPEIVQQVVSAAVDAEKRAAASSDHREVDLRELMRAWAGQFGVAAGDEKLDAALAAVGESWVGEALTPVPGVHEALKTLRGMGLRIGVVSNVFIPPAYCQAELQHEGLAELIDHAVFSSSVGYRKPSPRIYDAALAGVGAGGQPADPRRVLFVGDAPVYDVIVPAAMGMKTALVESGPGFWPAEDVARARPDLRIRSVAELPGLIGL